MFRVQGAYFRPVSSRSDFVTLQIARKKRKLHVSHCDEDGTRTFRSGTTGDDRPRSIDRSSKVTKLVVAREIKNLMRASAHIMQTQFHTKLPLITMLLRQSAEQSYFSISRLRRVFVTRQNRDKLHECLSHEREAMASLQEGEGGRGKEEMCAKRRHDPFTFEQHATLFSERLFNDERSDMTSYNFARGNS